MSRYFGNAATETHYIDLTNNNVSKVKHPFKMTTVVQNNINSFKSTAESYTDDIYNIAHDGSAIALGSEPSITNLPSVTGDWTIDLVFKSSVTTEQCLVSIDDGSGTRLLDVVQRDGDKIVLFYEGVETVLTYTTDTLPYEEWTHVVFGYKVSDKTLGLGCQTFLTTVTVTNDILLSTSHVVRFFRPVHVEDYFFNGHIDSHRISKYYRTEFFNSNPYNKVWYREDQVRNWSNPDGNIVSGGFTGDDLMSAEVFVTSSTKTYRWSNFCKFDSNRIMGTNSDRYTGAEKTILIFDPITEQGLNVSPRGDVLAQGIHYFERNNTVLFVNSTPGGHLQKILVGSETIQTVSSNGVYQSCRGDDQDRYLFGWKQDGSTNQIYRTDHNGLNEITVNTVDLLGTNTYAQSFCVDIHKDRLFFRNVETMKLNCVDFDLVSNWTEFPVTIPSGNGGTDYCDGYIYFPINGWIGRYHLDTGEVKRFDASFGLGGGGQRTSMYVDRLSGRMILHDEGYRTFTSTEADFSSIYMTFGFSTLTNTTLDISWKPVDSATGYNLYQNGILIATTTEPSHQATGLVVSGEYEFTVEYTLDGTNFVPNLFYRKFYFPEPGVGFYASLPASFDTSPFSYFVALTDPYSAEDLLYAHGGNLRKYNLTTGDNTLVTTKGSFAYGKVQSRVYANKRIYIKNGYRILDAGIEASKMEESTNISAFLNDSRNVVFDISEIGDTSKGTINEFVVSVDGNKIYYVTNTDEIWVYEKPSNSVSLVTDQAGRAVRGIDLDPLDQNSIVYTDFGKVSHLDISTGVITQIYSTFIGFSSLIYVLGGVVYAATTSGGSVKVNIDGTNLVAGKVAGSDTCLGMYLDTINKRTLYFQNGMIRVLDDPTIADLPADPSLFLVTPSPISLNIVWQEALGATSYSLRYTEGESSTLLSAVESTTGFRYTMRNLPPVSSYTLYLYYSVDNTKPSILIGSGTYYTLSSDPGNFDRSGFAGDSGGFDLSGYSAASLSSLDEVMNEVFNTGDEIQIEIGTKKTKTKFVKRGESAVIEGDTALSFGFVPSAGAGQSATITLSDSTDVTVEFDETTEELTINGAKLTSGQSIVLDGKKVTVVDI